MPPRALTTKKAESQTIEVGRVNVTPAEIRHAMTVLTDAPGIMVRQPLEGEASPLGDADYHGVANEQRRIDGEARMGTKSAFLRALERILTKESGT